jgi:LDH2 family malate/lactate/ureidoglycolate dehydrogenase
MLPCFTLIFTGTGQQGKSLPDGCGVGPDGKPSNDAADVLAGAQLPFAQHKGTAIALMVELLAVGMTGELHHAIMQQTPSSTAPSMFT